MNKHIVIYMSKIVQYIFSKIETKNKCDIIFLIIEKEIKQMSVLKYAILGLLNQRSMTGYEITKQFNLALCEFWNVNHSQIYPELKLLHKQKKIEYEVEISGNILEKKVYTITDTGKEDFISWLRGKYSIPPTSKDEFKLQLFFANELDLDSRIELIEHHLQQHRDRLNHLINNRKRFEVIPSKNSDDFCDYLVLMGAIMREENICSWLEECIRLYRE